MVVRMERPESMPKKKEEQGGQKVGVSPKQETPKASVAIGKMQVAVSTAALAYFSVLY